MITSDETYLKMLAQLSVEELISFRDLINTVLQEKPKETREPRTARFNPWEHFEREPGSRTMMIKSIEENLMGWPSLAGSYMSSGRDHYQIGPLYLDCASLENGRKFTLFQVSRDGQPVIVHSITDGSWTPEIAGIIEKYL
jgi:hypothetical protein